MSQVHALSPLDGRYAKIVEPVNEIFSEPGLFKYRIFVEAKYLIALCDVLKKPLSESAKNDLIGLAEITSEDYDRIKEFESQTNHDVKAVEYFMKERLKGKNLGGILELIHFGLTSDDTNNIAYALMTRDCVSGLLVPKLKAIDSALYTFADRFRSSPLLARTHSQPAVPTTFGKEIYNFYLRVHKQVDKLENIILEAKLNGAVGNFNAHYVAYSNIDWIRFSDEFITGLNVPSQIRIVPCQATTQIVPYDSYCELFDLLKRINYTLIGLDQDIWSYVGNDLIEQRQKNDEVGSSTMPHKVNPIDFESSEGVLSVANGFLEQFSRKLLISRLQRDLSDSPVKRCFGEAFGNSLVGYTSLLRGLGKIDINTELALEELKSHPEIITEGIQTILRRERVEAPYEKLKKLSRGKKITLDDIHTFIDGLNITDTVKTELKAITPLNYIGLAEKLVK